MHNHHQIILPILSPYFPTPSQSISNPWIIDEEEGRPHEEVHVIESPWEEMMKGWEGKGGEEVQLSSLERNEEVQPTGLKWETTVPNDEIRKVVRWNSERRDECDEKEGMEIQVEDNGESNGLLITQGEGEGDGMEW